MPPGSVLAGRDIRDYYRNFLVNPHSWWQTYTYVLGGFWFNPYLPFGASSCTSIAQRQSDALRAAAKVYGVPGRSVAILDDFLLICPRKRNESDESVLMRGEQMCGKFDAFLRDINLPKAPEKDQKPGFSTVWFGLAYYSKEGLIGITQKKWRKVNTVFHDTFISTQNNTSRIKTKVSAGELERALGLFHHTSIVWPAGRPHLWPLWCCFRTASFKFRRVNRTHALGKDNKRYRVLRSKSQLLILTDLAREALSYWRKRLQKEPPHRKIVRCQETCHISWINIIRRTIHKKQTLCIATPSTIWERPESLTQSDAVGVNGSMEAVWLAALAEGLATLDIPSGTIAILVRTNIRKLESLIQRDLYVRDKIALTIARDIHNRLWQMARKANEIQEEKQSDSKTYPLELRCTLHE